MKRLGIILALVGLSAVLGFGGEKTFSLLISGGITRLAPNDLNSFLRDFARYYLYYIDPSDGQNHISKELGRSSEFDLTLLVQIAPRIFLTFGSGLISAGLNSDPLVKSYGDLEVKLFRSDKIRSTPLRLGLLYSFPLSHRLSLAPHVSLDAYFSSFKDTGYEERTDLEDNRLLAHDEWDIQTTAFNWGSTWGLSLDISLSARVHLSLDGGYRRARLGGFQGKETRFDNGMIESERDFRLLYCEFYSDWMETGYNFLNLPLACGSIPLDIVRDAVIDLSGPFLKGGLRVSF